MTTNHRTVFRPALLGALALMLASCATTQPQSPEQVVAQRAKARWQAMLAGNYEAAYAYYSPGFRSSTPLSAFFRAQAGSRIDITSADFAKVSCEKRVCTAVFFVGYRVISPMPMVGEIKAGTRMEEKWLRLDGQWWYVPEQGSGGAQ